MGIQINIPIAVQPDLGGITSFEFTLTNFERTKEDWESAGIDLSFVDFDQIETDLLNSVYIPVAQIDVKTIDFKAVNITFTETFTGFFMDTISNATLTGSVDSSGISAIIKPGKTYTNLEVDITTNGVDQDYTLTLSQGNNSFDYSFTVITVLGTGSAGTSTTDFTGGGSNIWINEGSLPWSFSGSGTTPSNNTGPTTASGQNNFAFVEASGTVPGNTSIFRTSDFAKATQIQFDLHMFGSTMGSLFLQYSADSGATWNNVTVFNGQIQGLQGDSFFNFVFNLSELPVSQLRFFYTGATSFAADCSITNIQLTSV